MQHVTPQPAHVPKLDASSERRVQRIRPTTAPVIHESIREQGEEELARSASGLAWSGLAAGLSMGFSLVAEAIIHSAVPEGAPWASSLASLGYSFGFLIVILGRQQLFTENTLTAVLPLLARRDLPTFGRMLRLWGIVLATNVLGALGVAALIARTSAVEDGLRASLTEIARHAFVGDVSTTLIRGVLAGWIIATLVWMLPAVRSSQIAMIVLMTWLVSAGHFSHIVAGSVDVLYLVVIRERTVADFVLRFFLPTLIGNTIGGVSLVAALNHAQVIAGAEFLERRR